MSDPQLVVPTHAIVHVEFGSATMNECQIPEVRPQALNVAFEAGLGLPCLEPLRHFCLVERATGQRQDHRDGVFGRKADPHVV